MSIEIQDPSETLDHAMDWSVWLNGDTISASAWSISPAGPVLVDLGVAAGVATVTLSGVSFGLIYSLTNQVTTGAGRTAQRSITIRGFAE